MENMYKNKGNMIVALVAVIFAVGSIVGPVLSINTNSEALASGVSCRLTWGGLTESDGTGIRQINQGSNWSINVSGLQPNQEFRLANTNITNGGVTYNGFLTADDFGNFSLYDNTGIQGYEYGVGRYRTEMQDTSTAKIADCTPSFVIVNPNAPTPTPTPVFTPTPTPTPLGTPVSLSCRLTWGGRTEAGTGFGVRRLGDGSDWSINVSGLQPYQQFRLANTNLTHGGTTYNGFLTADQNGSFSLYDNTRIQSYEYGPGRYKTEMQSTSTAKIMDCTPSFIIEEPIVSTPTPTPYYTYTPTPTPFQYAPTVDFRANGGNQASVIVGNSVNLSWTTTNATSCVASSSPSSNWNGIKATNGSESVSFTRDTTLTLTCYGPGGSRSDSAFVNTYFQPTPTPYYTPTPYPNYNDAVCESINAPDYVNAGETFRATVTMRNTGGQAWTSNYNGYSSSTDQLRSTNGDNNTKWTTSRVELPYSPINPGYTATFAFDVTAPRYGGSQSFDWRMFDQNAGFFGRTCSKSINVRELYPTYTPYYTTYYTPYYTPTQNYNDAVCVSINAPTSVRAGQRFDATVTMRNTGGQAWSTGYSGYRLGSQDPQDNSTWGLGRVDLASGQVYPGQEATFRFSAVAPQRNGNLNFDWRMVQEHVQWFGQTCRQSINVSGAYVAPRPVAYYTPTPLPATPVPPATIYCQINGQVYPNGTGYNNGNANNTSCDQGYNQDNSDGNTNRTSWLASIGWSGTGTIVGVLIIIFLVCLIFYLLFRIMATRSEMASVR